MYDPLALDRQRTDQERLRHRANAGFPTARRAARRGHRLAAIGALLPHSRSHAGCPDSPHAVTG